MPDPDPFDETVADRVDRTRTKTREDLPLVGGRIEIDLSEASTSCAEFLELVSRVIRARRKITLIVE